MQCRSLQQNGNISLITSDFFFLTSRLHFLTTNFIFRLIYISSCTNKLSCPTRELFSALRNVRITPTARSLCPIWSGKPIISYSSSNISYHCFVSELFLLHLHILISCVEPEESQGRGGLCLDEKEWRIFKKFA